jgi:hypothetical protein
LSSSQLPPNVVSFGESHVSSIDELVVLIALMESSSRWWDARMVARELGILPVSASNILDHLAARNLLDIRITDEIRYQFRPATPELGAAAQEFAEAYRRYPADVIRAVMKKATNRSARDFADAFRIRRDESS